MNFLLDTCAFLWLTSNAGMLSHSARAVIEDPGNEVFLSAASIFEIGILNAFQPLGKKYSILKLLAIAPKEYDLVKLDVTVSAAARLARLPSIHKDPFDRMLICQAIQHGLTLITPDEKIHRYPVSYLW